MLEAILSNYFNERKNYVNLHICFENVQDSLHEVSFLLFDDIPFITSLLSFRNGFEFDRQCIKCPWLLKMGIKPFLHAHTIFILQYEWLTLHVGRQVSVLDGSDPFSQPLETLRPSDLSHHTSLTNKISICYM